jgi:hypothetical protein
VRQVNDMAEAKIVTVAVPNGLANLIAAGKRLIQLPLTASR